jgi:hypothetical protein
MELVRCGKQTGNKDAVAAIKLKTQGAREDLRSILDDIRAHWIISVRKITKSLTAVTLAPCGGERQPITE